MKAPITVDLQGDILFYASGEDAALDLEPIDVKEGCVAYDRDGNVLDVAVEPIEITQSFLGIRRKMTIDKVVLRARTPRVQNDEVLVRKIRQFLLSAVASGHIKSGSNIQNASLSDLMDGIETYGLIKINRGRD